MRKWLSNLMVLVMLFSLLIPVTNVNAASRKVTLEELEAQLEAAKADTAEKKAAMDAAYEASEEATQKEAQGSAAFFDYCGCTAASDILKTDWAKDYTEIGAAKDTTSLSNLKAAIPFIKECNTLRLQEGTDPDSGDTLGVLKVSLMLMAISEVQGNWSANQSGHCGKYNVAENLAWGYSDPFVGWYTEEKAEWDGGNHEFKEVGHYLNMCSADYTVTGFAVNQKSSYRVAHEQSFLWSAYNSSDIVMSVDDFEAKVNEYVNSIEAAKTAYTEAKAAYDRALAYEQELEDQIANYNSGCEEHTPVVDEAVAATCTEAGKTEGSHCSECGEVLEEQEVVPALGHSVVTDEAVAATCTKAGKTEGSHCDRCKEILEEQEVISALGHSAVTDEAVAATCTKAGKTEGSHCDRCKEILEEQEVISALGHSAVTDEAVAATCTEAGKTEGSHCDRCKEILEEQEVVPALGHLVVGEGGKEPTCTEDGISAVGHCDRCDETLEEPTVIPALGHSIVTDEAVAATCTEAGKTEGSHCDRCKKVLVKQEVIPATGHSYEQIIKPATTKKDGSIITKCSVCDKKDTKTIPAIKDVYIKPTSVVYNGTAQKVTVVCKNREGQTISSKFYRVGYLYNTYVGTATVVVRFHKYYDGEIRKTFNINPVGTKFVKYARGSRSLALAWNKQPTFTSGYILQYSTDPGFAASKTKTLYLNRYTTSQTIKNLRGNTKYYIRIRTYYKKTVNGKTTKYYSNWSSKRYVVTRP